MFTLILGALIAIITIVIVPAVLAHNDFHRESNIRGSRYNASLLAAISATTSLAIIGWRGLINLALLMDFNQPGEPQGVAIAILIAVFVGSRSLATMQYNRQWEKSREEKMRRKKELETRKSIKHYQAQAFAEQHAQHQLKKAASTTGQFRSQNQFNGADSMLATKS